MWDTAGQERYGTLAPMFFRNSVFILLVYSAVDIQSLEKCDHWLDNITDALLLKPEGVPKCLPIVLLVENKCDLKPTRHIVQNEENALMNKMAVMRRRFMKLHNADFIYKHIQCSALTKEGIAPVFDEVYDRLKQVYGEWDKLDQDTKTLYAKKLEVPKNHQPTASSSSWCSLQ